LEYESIHIKRAAISAKAEVSKRVDYIPAFVDLYSLNNMRMCAKNKISSAVYCEATETFLIPAWSEMSFDPPMEVCYYEIRASVS
jgi:hypothetical protein